MKDRNESGLNETHLDLLYSLGAMVKQAIADHKAHAHYKREAEYWRTQYNEHLSRSINNSEKTIANMLMLSLTCDITPREDQKDAIEAWVRSEGTPDQR